MADKYSVNQFDQSRNYDLKLQNRGRKTGLTFEFTNDLQQYIDQGIFVDEKSDGFTNREKRDLADELANIHEEKGYDTDFRRMRENQTFTYTAEEYVRLAKAAGYVLKEPEAANELAEQLNQRSLFTEEQQQEIMFKVINGEDADMQAQSNVFKNQPNNDYEGAGAETVLKLAPAEPAKITPLLTEVPKLTGKIDLSIKTPEPKLPEQNSEDEFAILNDEEEIEVEPVNPDELADDTGEVLQEETEPSLPIRYLKRNGINSMEEFNALTKEQQAELTMNYAKSVRKIEKHTGEKTNLISKVFEKKAKDLQN